MTPSINFVIWGIRNGFSRNILTSINTPEEVLAVLNDDLRQVCSGTIDVFYLIQKTSRFTLISIVNPNTKDHVGRKAYIVITLYFPKEYTLSTDSVELLDSLMIYYSDKQGSAMANMITEDMFAQQIAGVTLIQESGIQSYYSDDKKGSFVYDSKEKLCEIFKSLNIRPYSKIIFHNGLFEPTQLPGYEKAELSRKVLIQLKDFDTNRYVIRLNEKQLWESGNLITINAFPGDEIRIYSKVQSNDKTIRVTESLFGVTYTPTDLFPIKSTVGFSSGNFANNNFELVSNKTLKKKKFKKVLLIFVVFLFVCAGGYFLYPLVFGNDEKCLNDSIKDSGSHWVKDSTFSADYYIYHNDLWYYSSDTCSVKMQPVEDTTIINYLDKTYNISDIEESTNLEENESSWETYTVQKGEGLDKIAQKLKVPKDSLADWNNIDNIDKINAGLTLRYRKPDKNSSSFSTANDNINTPENTTENNRVGVGSNIPNNDCDKLRSRKNEVERLYQNAPPSEKQRWRDSINSISNKLVNCN